MAGPVEGIKTAQGLLLELGPRRGYFPEPDKSILISPIAMPPSTLESLALWRSSTSDIPKGTATWAASLAQVRLKRPGWTPKPGNGLRESTAWQGQLGDTRRLPTPDCPGPSKPSGSISSM